MKLNCERSSFRCLAPLGYDNDREGLVKRLRELRIAIVNQDFTRQLLFFDVLLERFGLFQNPGFIGMVTGRRDVDSATVEA
jgi:hypothetical protein